MINPEESNGQRLRRFIDAFERGDAAEQVSLVHTDVVFYSPESLPYGGKWYGHAGWQNMKRGIAEVWSELSLKITRVIGEDHSDLFVVVADLSAQSRKTGKLYDCEVMEQWHWRDGLLIMVKPYYWDTRRVAEIIGEIPCN